MIKTFDNVKDYFNHRREQKNFIEITSRFGNGYTLKDNYNLITETEQKNLGYTDEFEEIKKEYNYENIDQLKKALMRNQTEQFIILDFKGHVSSDLSK